LAGVLALYSLVEAGLSYRQLQDRRNELARRTASAAASAVTASPAAKPAPTYERSAREMLAAAQAPWPGVLVALETASVPGVEVNSVEIVVAERTARVELEAVSYAAVLQYLDELNAGEAAPRWVLQSAESRAVASGVGNGHVVGRIHRRF
jgi:hypothetical protein